MLETFVFTTFAVLLIVSSLMVVFSSHTIQSILWLALSFVAAAALWICMNAEFLGLILILVYVGAVLTFFLFVMMTLSSAPLPKRLSEQQIHYYILFISLTLLGLGCVLYGLYHQWTHFVAQTAMSTLPQQANTQILGKLLYTDFIYPFELTGILLFTAIVVSISLHSGFHVAHPHHTKKNTSKHTQIHIQRKDRIKLVQGDK